MSGRLGSLVIVLCLVASPVIVGQSAAGDGPGRQVIVVDDDFQQCPQADVTSVQAALTVARDGALVRVCPGVYPGQITIDKAVTVQGRPEAIAGVDCFATGSGNGALDPTTYPILQRPAGQSGNLVTINARGVTVAGLVLEGARTVVPEAPAVEDAAVHLAFGSTPARVRHNLITGNSLGVDLGADGSAQTRVDHNCLRDNDWGMASQRQDFVGGRIDHNESSGHEFSAYEVGWARASNRATTYDANVSRADAVGFLVANSSTVTIAGNDLTPTARGVQLFDGNTDIAVSGNQITGGNGIGVQFVPGAVATRDVIVADNAITGFLGATGFGVGVGTDAQGRPSVVGLLVTRNRLGGNNVGLSVQPNNLDVVADHNVADGNLQYGVWSRARAGGGRYESNTMLHNGLADARDDNRAANTWTANVCERDLPLGTICGQSVLALSSHAGR